MQSFYGNCFSVIATVMVITLGIDQTAMGGEAKFPAFPGAEGAGAYTRGGRGGKVIFVTNLTDYDPRKEKPIAGSLRAAVATPGPRIIVFQVAGNITLKHDLVIQEPFVTIAGQSAPGGGICLTNYGLGIETHDVVLRHVRIRPGDVEKKECDAVSCSGRNVIIDHCSTSWAIDEVLSTNGDSANVTVQWCLITESLNRSYHHKGSHGYGSLISGPGEISYHHNVYAYHRSRNPRPGDVLLDFRNNLIYGWGDRAGYCGDERLRMNYVGNDLRPLIYSKSPRLAFLPGGPHPRIYLAENRLQATEAAPADDWFLIRTPNGMTEKQARDELRVTRPFATSEVTTDSPDQATLRVLNEGGATLPVRDDVDVRVVNQIRGGTGQIINSQSEVGSWPVLAAGTAPADHDGDGMSDEWELKYHLDPNRFDGSDSDRDGDGYADVEEFLNGTNPQEKDLWIFPPTIRAENGEDFVGANHVILATQSDGAEIHYTLDGSLPERSSPRYEGSLELNRSATLRTCAFAGEQRSHVQNVSFQQLTWNEPIAPMFVLPGLCFDYYEKSDWTGFPDFSKLEVTASGIVPQISLAPRRRDGEFGLLCKGLFEAPRDGVYHFYLRCSPLGQLLMHDRPVVESEGRRCERVGAIALKRGMHPLQFQIYFPSDDDKTLSIRYEGPEIPLQPLSLNVLFHDASN